MKDKYQLTVGLEIHAELNTRTKMFCGSKNDPDETRPNVNICPVCMGHPGTLPTINKGAVRKILQLGMAVGGELADYAEFDRKNYFYPDIPKGYQISQYKHPLVKGGELAGVKLTRIHLEEDTAKSTHDKGDESLIDFNRAGIPLMELVTEPVIHEPETAARFAKELQLLISRPYLNISHANMEKGEMRIEANVSVSRSDLGIQILKVGPLGTKVEVKNLNSFRSVERAIKYEFERQTALLEKGERVTQETRGWDENKNETFSQRAKEESHDYRYFPDPDLPKLFIKEIPEFDEEVLKKSLPELPWQKRERYRNWGISDDDIEIYINDLEKSKKFESLMGLLKKTELAQSASNFTLNEWKRPIQVSSVLGVIEMVHEGKLSSKGAKDVFKLIPETETDSRKFAKEKKLIQESNREVLEKIVEEVLNEEDSKAPVQFLIGQAMKKSQGRANPVILQEIFRERQR